MTTIGPSRVKPSEYLSARIQTISSAPAISNDGQTVYIAVNNGASGVWSTGDLVAVNSNTLAVQHRVALLDPSSGSAAYLPDIGTASPTVGPDGDVYVGVLENPFPNNNDRGWLLHFSGDLTRWSRPPRIQLQPLNFALVSSDSYCWLIT